MVLVIFNGYKNQDNSNNDIIKEKIELLPIERIELLPFEKLEISNPKPTIVKKEKSNKKIVINKSESAEPEKLLAPAVKRVYKKRNQLKKENDNFLKALSQKSGSGFKVIPKA